MQLLGNQIGLVDQLAVGGAGGRGVGAEDRGEVGGALLEAARLGGRVPGLLVRLVGVPLQVGRDDVPEVALVPWGDRLRLGLGCLLGAGGIPDAEELPDVVAGVLLRALGSVLLRSLGGLGLGGLRGQRGEAGLRLDVLKHLVGSQTDQGCVGFPMTLVGRRQNVSGRRHEMSVVGDMRCVSTQ
ncbi:hypothetical protein QZH56_36975 (plasmid) [Streptomyces olivoreticuli]|uniref:hypothetical protein n=1 Tax=Streptomyces olivoreticuli TaxID=68246 RepID=UPI0026584A46|nr:hypothetical protein [Streptomyces olivoreticuli]WKK27846.1 hypothetical protein QZH56_36975 [Streptomyces olivoreticuli]